MEGFKSKLEDNHTKATASRIQREAQDARSEVKDKAHGKDASGTKHVCYWLGALSFNLLGEFG